MSPGSCSKTWKVFNKISRSSYKFKKLLKWVKTWYEGPLGFEIIFLMALPRPLFHYFGLFITKQKNVKNNLSSMRCQDSDEWSLDHPLRYFFKWAQSRPLLLFIFVFSSCYNLNSNLNWFKHRWYAWDSNLGRQDGRRKWIHWAMAAPLGYFSQRILLGELSLDNWSPVSLDCIWPNKYLCC